MTFSRRRVSFRPALETMDLRITPSDLIACMPAIMPTSTMTTTTTTSLMPIEPPSSDIQPTTVVPTYTIDNVPPMYPPDGTPGTTPQDYI